MVEDGLHAADVVTCVVINQVWKENKFAGLKVQSVILEKARWYLNSSAKQTHPSLQRSFKLMWVTHSISLSCIRARDATYYTKWVFSGNVAKASVFDVLDWWLYPSHSVCFLFTEPGLCVNTGLFFSAHTEQKASGPRGDILRIWQKVFWIKNRRLQL